jgi:coproporphyrinogen III oxidase-like Fe-S oxidoreductase
MLLVDREAHGGEAQGGIGNNLEAEAKDRDGNDFSRANKARKEEPGCSPRTNGTEAIRFATPDSLEQYMAGAALQRTPILAQAALEESFFLGLRLTRGISLVELAADFGTAATEHAHAIANELVGDGLLELQEDRIRLTARGRLLSNEVFGRFILADKLAG